LFHSQGPITGADGCAGAFLPLQVISSEYKSITDEARSQTASQYLYPNSHPTIIKGFEAQKALLLDSYESNTTAAIELPFTGKFGSGNIFLKPLSRGSINIDPTSSSGAPIIDFGVLTNPVDLKINLAAFKLSRQVYSSPHMSDLGPVETSPGKNVTTDDEIIAWIHSALLPSSAHPCGTAAMMPRELGGVVRPDLLVYGVQRLSIVDASIMPLIPGTHLSATVYAIAEKVSKTYAEFGS
jgi:choline dehydrogenase-like flavoprotein